MSANQGRMCVVAALMIALAASFVTTGCNRKRGHNLPQPQGVDVARPPQDASERVVFLTEERLETLRQRLAAKVQPNTYAAVLLEVEARDLVGFQPHAPETFFVPRARDDEVGRIRAISAIQSDAEAAYALALFYQMTAEEELAETAANIIRAWISGDVTYRRDHSTKLGFALFFPYMIFAADLLDGSPHFGAEDDAAMTRFLREEAATLTEAYELNNNRGNTGLFLDATAAGYLQDDELLDAAATRWKELLEHQVQEDGSLQEEIIREPPTASKGVNYSHVAMKSIVLAAEILRVNGRDVYDYVGANGETLRQAYETLVGWVRYPETYPYYTGDDVDDLIGLGRIDYFEILHERWPSEDGHRLVINHRMADSHLSFTHATLLEDAGP